MSETDNNNIDKRDWLENDSFDVLIVGTGFIESTLAGALSRAGKSVLTMDPNTYYGGYDTSFNLNHLITILNENNVTESNNSNNRNEYSSEQVIKLNSDSKKLPLYFNNVKIVSNENKEPEVSTKEDSVEVGEEKPKPKTCEELGRAFSIDILPNILYSKGSLVSLLIASSTAKYLEFKNLDQNYLYFKGALNEIPSTKGSIFKDNTFSLLEKRTIMKFITIIQELFEESTKSQETVENNNNKQFNITISQKYQELASKYETYYQFIKAQKFTEKVETFILHGITLQQESIESLPLRVGIESVYLYISSLLIYSPNPFLLSYYGCGDIPQALVRLSAVFGGTFVLNRSVDQITVDTSTNQVSGIVCCKGQTIHSKNVVITPKFIDHIKLPNVQSKVYSRFIGITDKKLPDTQEQSLVIVPPNAISNKNCVNIIQMDTICVPYNKNRTLFQITTISDSNNAELDLKPTIENFFNLTIVEESKKPNLLWYCYFNVTLDIVDQNEKPNLPSNLFVVSDSPLSQTMDYQMQIEECKKIFSQICPNEIFLEKVPDQEDIIYNYQETDTNTTENQENTTANSTDTNTTTENQENTNANTTDTENQENSTANTDTNTTTENQENTESN